MDVSDQSLEVHWQVRTMVERVSANQGAKVLTWSTEGSRYYSVPYRSCDYATKRASCTKNTHWTLHDTFNYNKEISSRVSSNPPLPGSVMLSPARFIESMGTGRKPLENETQVNSSHESVYFRDGKRRIDMVLAFEEESTRDNHLARRQVFEENLEEDGLELEFEDKMDSARNNMYFLKIHAPWDTLAYYAELLDLKMPLKEEPDRDLLAESKSNFFFRFFHAAKNTVPVRNLLLTAPFTRQMEDKFSIDNKDTFFMPAQRSMIVWYILSNTCYGKEEEHEVGITRLINKGTYVDAYPLHDGDFQRDDHTAPWNQRQILFSEWANFRCWNRQQPLTLVRDYFGDKVGLYFAWLGFYTHFLISAAIVGVLCFAYGIFTVDGEFNSPSREICNMSGAGNVTMCPLCDEVCTFWKLGDSCLFSKVSYLFDNPATVVFSIFMSIWATAFLESWKRRQARLAWEWDLLEPGQTEEEQFRPEYEAQAKSKRVSPVTKLEEPYIPLWNRSLRYATSVGGVLLLAIVLTLAMLAVVFYRLIVVITFTRANSVFVSQNAKLFTSVTAALINLVVIQIFNLVGRWIAKVLTNFEAPRTQSEYENSYSFKVFVFEFVNVYSSLIYIGIFKGRFYGHPADTESKDDFSMFKRLQADVPDPAGTLFELCIQLAIIMVGRQIMNNFLEIFLPKILNWWRYRNALEEERKSHPTTGKLSRWETDFHLESTDSLPLYEEYLEMVIQYGFVTLFVAAFPLAPLFALINNIIEIRVDAYNFVTQIRRPVAQRVTDIGVWGDILRGITYLAVAMNAFIIAYTSDFIPRLVVAYENQYELDNYFNETLSVFRTSDYKDGMGPAANVENKTKYEYCAYRAYKTPPWHPEPYKLNELYWNITAARLAFVVVFEHLVFSITGLVAYVIPDVQSTVRDMKARERQLERDAYVAQQLEATGKSKKKKKDAQQEAEEDIMEDLEPEVIEMYEADTRTNPDLHSPRQKHTSSWS